MAYLEKYYGEFYYDHDSDKSLYRISILQDGFADTATELTLAGTPFVINVRGQRDTIDNVVMGSEAEISFIAVNGSYSYLLDETGERIENESGSGYVELEDSTAAAGSIVDYDSILESQYKDYLVKLIADPDGTPEVKWVGFVLPENCTRDFVAYKYIYTISATDGLAQLKDIDYKKATLTPFTGFESIIDIVKNAISKVATVTELQLDFRVQLGTYSDLMTSTQCALEETEVNQEIFYELNEDYEYDDCYTVLSKVLAPFNCVLRQSDGYYWIQNIYEPSSYVFSIASVHSFSWTLAASSRAASDLRINTNSYKFLSQGSLSIVEPAREIITTVYNKRTDADYIVNGGFDEDVVGWTNGDADDSSNTGSVSWYDYAGVGGTLQFSVGSGANAYNFHTTADITFDEAGGSIYVRITGTLTEDNRSGGASAVPLARIRLWNSTDGYVTGSIGQQPFLSVGGFYMFTETFASTGITVDDNYIDFEVEVTDATTTSAVFHFDDAVATQPTTTEPADWKITAIRPSVDFEGAREYTLYLADQFESVNDSAAIKDSGGDYTETWDRYGLTDTLPLVRLFNQNLANDFGAYRKYLRTTIYDESEVINSHNFVGFDWKNYRFLGYSKDYREGTIDADLAEVLTTEVTVNQYTQKLDTIYGEDQ